MKQEQNEEYKKVSERHGVCPKCGSEDINYSGKDRQDYYLIYPAICNKCHASWNEVYNIVPNGCWTLVKKEQ